ncbi:MAG: DUF4010 domain-containing protein [Sphingomonadales bacterium]|nr:DUF4010 domain-containing protein [Sphingomonadales bacterium]
MIVALGRADLLNLALALALGLLIGIQRGWAQREEPDGTRFAGVRTYGLFGLVGGIAGVAAPHAGAVAVVMLAATAALVLIGYWRTSAHPTAVSGTASLVGLLTIACGYFAGNGSPAAAAAAAGSIVLLLAMRGPLHQLVSNLEEREVMAIGRFALIALVILPLLPNTPFGPFDAWRPRSLWLVVVLVSGFSFAGYLAAKWLGPSKGTLATAAAGSLVSSTAVTAAMAARHRAGDGDPDLLNAAIALGSAVMFARVVVLAGALAPFAVPTLAMAAVPGTIVSLAGTVWLRRRARAANSAVSDDVKLRNPFDIGPALLMMALVMAMTAAARWALVHFGDRGLAVVLAISGTADVDSAIITLGSLPPGTLAAHTAGLVLIAPTLLNTAFKASIALSVGGWERAWPGAAPLGLSIVAALAGTAVAM